MRATRPEFWKTSVLSFLLTILQFVVWGDEVQNPAHNGTTWYFNGGGDAINSGITTPNKWIASGKAASEFSATDYYIVRGDARLRINNKTFEGGPLQIGDLSNNTRGGILNDAPSSTTAFPNGLYFDCGYYLVNIYISLVERRDGALDSSGGITVRSPADKPFVFHCSSGGNYSNRRLFINAPISSDENAGIVVGPAKVMNYSYGCGTNFMVSLCGDCSDYKGLISVTTAQNVAAGKWDVRLGVGNITVGGKVRMARGTAITAWRGACNTATSEPTECTIGSLELAAYSVIQVYGNRTTPKHGIIHVRDELTIDKPVTIRMNYDASVPGLTPTRLTLLTAPSSSRLDPSDFIFDIGSTSKDQYYDLVVEEDVATQTKSLVAVFGPTVTQTKHYTDESNKERAYYYSSFTNSAHWSDLCCPHENAHYYTRLHYLRTIVDSTKDYDFPGLSFTQAGGRFTIFTKSFRVPEYIVRDPENGYGVTYIWLGQDYNITKTIKVNRFVAKSGIVELGAYDSQTLVIDGEIVGAGDFLLQGVTSTGATKGNYRFTGLNTNFTGSITVRQQTAGAYLTFDNLYQTLFVNDGRNLGGAKDAFDPKALKLETMSRISVTNGTVTLNSGLNRGVHIKSGRFFVDASCTLCVNWPITMQGRMWKEGAGTLVLGSDVRYDSADGEPKSMSNLFSVVEGTVKVTAYNAMDGLSSTFDDNTSLVLVINPEDAKLTKYGILNARTDTPFALGSNLAKLPLSVDISAYPEVTHVPQTFGIVTVTNIPETVATVRALLPKIKPYSGINQCIVERENAGEGTVTFALELKSPGMRIIIR